MKPSLVPNLSINNTLYKIGLILLPFILLGTILVQHITPNQVPSFPCVLRQFTGLYCPGCGGTRAILAICSGRVLQSLWYHPLVPYTAGWYLIFMITHTLERCKVPHVKGLQYRDIYLYIAIGIIIFHFVLKNVLAIFFKI